MRTAHGFQTRSHQTRLVAAALVAFTVASTGPALSNPGDIFQVAAPAVGSGPAKGADINAGDTSVSPTGAFQYSYPIAVPPGRNGMQPSLALSYSSQAPIYGGIAAGWNLSGLPIITLDTSHGRIFVPQQTFVSSMAGNRPLIAVTEPWLNAGVRQAYRAQNDSSYTRYERMNAGTGPRWKAFSSDGTTYYFGDSDHHTCGAIVSDEYAPLTRMVDKFGNVVEYFYRSGPSDFTECRIDYITWGQNAPAGVAGYFAAAVFNFQEVSTCGGIPIGSQSSWRSGTKITTGATRLSSITIAAFAPGTGNAPTQVIPTVTDHTRTITLGYSTTTESCTAAHGAYRSLSFIRESAVGVDSPQVTLPDITFTYGSADFGNAPLNWPATSTSYGMAWADGELETGRADYNLGWGYRWTNGSRPPTVQAMMIDVDGDGLLDRLWSDPPHHVGAPTGSVYRCRAHWLRNTGVLGQPFQDKGVIELPTLKWASPGSFTGGTDSAIDGTEGCSLNYQLTKYTNCTNPGSGGFACPPNTPACPSGSFPAHCSDGNDCYGKNGSSGPTTLSYRWFDINGDQLPDLVVSPTQGGFKAYDLQWGTLPNAPQEPAIFAPFPWTSTYPCPSPTASAYPGDPNQLYTMCDGMFPWIVYKNHGNGIFGTPQGTDNNPVPDDIIYEPIPLETAAGDSSVTSTPVGNTQGTVDIDGDGFLDAVNVVGSTWSVFGNDGTGHMKPWTLSNPYSFPAPNATYITNSYLPFNAYNPLNVETIFDLNGDGLSDHWSVLAATPVPENANAAYNDGMQFQSGTFVIDHRPGTDAVAGYPSPCPGSGCNDTNGQVINGWRTEIRRPFDMDFDGRVDVMSRPDTNSSFTTNFNQGGQFTPAVSTSFVTVGQAHRIMASEFISGSLGPQTWEVRSDFIDLDGDGIPEAVDFGGGIPQTGSMAVWKMTTPTVPPRVLTTINNGRGATTTVTYSPLTGASVTQEPALAKSAPDVHWVVSSQATLDTVDTPNTTSTTSYAYVDPRVVKDPVDGKYAFRGFEKIKTTLPTGAMREDAYDFSIDATGRLVSTIVHPDASTEARTIDTTTWQAFQLFGGLITTYHPVTKEHFVCSNGQTSATCTAAAAAGYSKTSITMASLASSTVGGIPLMWQESSSLLQKGTAAADGDRRYDTSYFLKADGTDYRLVVEDESRYERLAGVFTVFGRHARKWTDQVFGDSSYRVIYQDTVYSDANLANASTTYRTFDLLTGNVKKVWRPAQWALNGDPNLNLNRTTFDYDSRQLFIAIETNELGHVRNYTWEYGTGTKVETLGPNVPACAVPVPNTCPSGSPLKEDHKIRVDGMGREIQRYESFGDYGTSYQLLMVETNAYADTGPLAVTHQSAIDYDGTTVRWTQDDTSFDGHGRPIRKVNRVLGSAPADQVTTLVYANDGTLSQVTVPDPTANDSTTVSYTYTFDSLGRPKSFRRPDATLAADKSGIDITYDGLTKTTSEFVGVAGGQASVGKTYEDVFGRLTRVDELRVSPSTYATTTYSYDANDNVKQIVDPESVTTTLVHDQASRRLQITRNTRTWSYGYDKDGNVTSETTPCTGTNCAASYTTTTAYDALDRPTSKLLAPRALSSADLTLFGAAQETFIYDTGNNGKGRLAQWNTFAPNSGTPTLQSSPAYNAQGQQGLLNQTTNAAGYSGLTRNFFRRWDISGAPREAWFYDIMGTQNCVNGSMAYTQYDNRGLPSSVQIQTCVYDPNTPYSYMVNTRDVAGLVTRRYSQQAVGAIVNAESDWTFDKLGRVTSQVVKKGAALDQVARQDLLYFGSDDPKQLDHWLGATNHKRFAYGFDLRHQLTSVSESLLPNAFTATYTYGGAGRFASANESSASLPNSDVKTRNVTYQYSGTDPERLITLKKTNNQTYASYTYDDGGNQLTRTYSGNPTLLWEYVYDGKNQLRRATKKSNNVVQGSEEYWYDQLGRRTLLVKRDGAGNKTELIWFIEDTEAHYDVAGNVTKVYGYATMGTPVFRVERTTDAASTVEYQFHGLANNTLAAVDQLSGTINASFNYAPFGEIVEATDAGGSSGGVAKHRRRMNDKYADEISELAYYGFRYYDKTSMTWTQSDPLYRFVPDLAKSGSPRRANLYQFSLSNPLRYLDPDGRNSVPGISSYKSEAEQRNAYIRALEADDNWMVSGIDHFSDQAYTRSSGHSYGGPTEPPTWARGCGGGPAGSMCIDPEEVEELVIAAVEVVSPEAAEELEEFGTKVEDKAEAAVGALTESVNVEEAAETLTAEGTAGAQRVASTAGNFAEGQLDSHFAKHAAEWGAGNITKIGYLKRAQDLVGRTVGGDILGAVRSSGDILRYNVRTNEFAVQAANGTIRTLFRPNDGMGYWVKQLLNL